MIIQAECYELYYRIGHLIKANGKLMELPFYNRLYG